MIDVVERFLFTGADARRLGSTRLLLGLGLIPFFWMQFGSFFDIRTLGPRFFFVDQIWYFRAVGIERFEPWISQMSVVGLTLTLAAFALGWRARASAIASLLLIVFLKGMRDSVAGDVHHRELIPCHVLLFFACSRSGESFSVDASRGGGGVAEWEASWPIAASQLYVASFYWWSGFAKLRSTGLHWFGPLTSAQLILERSVRFAADPGMDSVGAFGLWVAQHPSLLLLAGVGVAAMELGFPAILFLRALWMRIVFVAGVAFF